MNIIINAITLFLVIILIILLIIIGMTNPTYTNKNRFYGDPPGKQRSVSLQDLANDRGWASFRCYTQQGFDIDCNKLYGHQGLSPDAMIKYQEFGEYYNQLQDLQ